MSKTADLRKLITTELNKTPGVTYYKNAPKTAAFPYKTFELSRVDFGNSHRDDLDLCVDVWDHASDPKAVDEIADQIEELLEFANLPQDTILPSFFRENRYPVNDPDITIQHIQLHFLVENYTREE